MESQAVEVSAPRRVQRRKALMAVVAIAASIGIGWYAWLVLVADYRESTDNAYVAGHQIHIASQIAGHVAAVHVDDTQKVRQGDLLVELDATDAEIALQKAQAELAQAVRQVRQWQDTAALSAALVDVRAAEAKQALIEQDRREQLLRKRVISGETMERARTQASAAQSQLTASQRQVAADRARVDGISLQQHPAVMAARAAYLDAAARLQRTRIVAPAAGVVTQRVVQVGNQIQSGQSLLRIVPTNNLWVDANFKESQLRNLRVGQPVEVYTDLYGSAVRYRGKVAGFSPGTGAAFALLPPQNAAGNWVKVVQRVPVRIALAADELAKYPLQIGVSSHVVIDTHQRDAPALAAGADNHAAITARTVAALDLSSAEAEADAIIARNANQKITSSR